MRLFFVVDVTHGSRTGRRKCSSRIINSYRHRRSCYRHIEHFKTYSLEISKIVFAAVCCRFNTMTLCGENSIAKQKPKPNTACIRSRTVLSAGPTRALTRVNRVRLQVQVEIPPVRGPEPLRAELAVHFDSSRLPWPSPAPPKRHGPVGVFPPAGPLDAPPQLRRQESRIACASSL